MQRFFHNAAFVLALAAFSAISTTALADWDPLDPADVAKAKWIQMPDMSSTGLDVLDTLQPISPVPPLWKTLADDFPCTQTGPITDAHIWGSWLNDQVPLRSDGVTPDPGLIEFQISFWSDVPQNPTDPTSFSHPGNLLWTGLFQPGQFTWRDYGTAPEGFYDPNVGQIIGFDNRVIQYNFPSLVDALGQYFVQQQGNIYWFEVQANVLNTPGLAEATFGWKTRDPDPTHFHGGHFLDDAVFADTAGFAGAPSPWRELRYPGGHPLQFDSIDLAFVLTVPEPGTIAMAGIGLAVLAGMVYQRRKAAVC
jgi:hypothetical protein